MAPRARPPAEPPPVCFYADRVTASQAWWKENGAARRTLSTIATGVTTPWAGKPPTRLPQVRPLSVTPEDEPWLLSEVERLDDLGIFRPATRSSATFRAQAFVAKNANKRRLVVYLKPLNAFCATPVFTMEGVKELAAMIKPTAWMWSVDLKDAYYAQRVAPTAGAASGKRQDGTARRCREAQGEGTSMQETALHVTLSSAVR